MNVVSGGSVKQKLGKINRGLINQHVANGLREIGIWKNGNGSHQDVAKQGWDKWKLGKNTQFHKKNNPGCLILVLIIIRTRIGSMIRALHRVLFCVTIATMMLALLIWPVAGLALDSSLVYSSYIAWNRNTNHPEKRRRKQWEEEIKVRDLPGCTFYRCS